MITETIRGIPLTFETARTSFSPRCVDKGTLLMLSRVAFSPGDKVLDLGCGYGAAGIYAARLIGEENIYMSDINKKNLILSAKNAALNGVSGVKIIHSDGFKDIDETGFTLILSNPPYHADFSVPRHFIEKGFNRLGLGGKMYMVTKRKTWYKNKLIAVFGGVTIYEADGYFVFCGEKRSMRYAKGK